MVRRLLAVLDGQALQILWEAIVRLIRDRNVIYINCSSGCFSIRSISGSSPAGELILPPRWPFWDLSSVPPRRERRRGPNYTSPRPYRLTVPTPNDVARLFPARPQPPPPAAPSSSAHLVPPPPPPPLDPFCLARPLPPPLWLPWPTRSRRLPRPRRASARPTRASPDPPRACAPPARRRRRRRLRRGGWRRHHARGRRRRRPSCLTGRSGRTRTTRSVRLRGGGGWGGGVLRARILLRLRRRF